MNQRPLNCLHCPRPVAFLDEEQLKIHLRKNFKCLAFKCVPCSDRFATHGELRNHYSMAHGLRATREQLIAEQSEELLAGRRNVEVYIAAAFSQQRGEVIDLDSATIYTADYGGNPMGAPPQFPRQLVAQPFPLRQPTIGTASLQVTLGGTRGPQLPPAQDEGSAMLGDGGFIESNGVPIVPLPAQVAVPTQPQQQERAPQQPTGVGDYECQYEQCRSRVPDSYLALRQHAIRHAGPGAIHSQPDRQQRLLQEFMIRCFPNSPVLNDMTCLVCKYVERGSLDRAKHLQTIHVQESHLEIEELAVHCPADDCPIREQLLPSLQELKDHLKRDHRLRVQQLAGEEKRRYDETARRAKEMTDNVRVSYFPFTPMRRR